MLFRLRRCVVPYLVWLCAALCFMTGFTAAHAATAPLPSSYTFQRNGWTYVHLQGTPQQIGYQHGYLLANQIEDALQVFRLEDEHTTHRSWKFFHDAAKNMLWPHIGEEYQEELMAMAEGVQAKGVHIDVWDLVALNGTMELAEYYVPWLDKQQHDSRAPRIHAPGNCSAFIATGSYTKDGKIVLAHNNWSSYAEGARWTVVFDIQPAHGHHILMEGVPGMITSNDDFGLNSAGIMVAETTITQFEGWNPEGTPEFVRSRKALQYASSIDEYVAIMREGNNGGYANDWLIGDRKTGEIAYLELGLKHTPLWRTNNGYFVSSNFPRDPALIRDETEGFNPRDLSTSPNARRARWEQEMKEHRGGIDLALAQQFLADHVDSYTHQTHADQRTLCGHVDAAKGGIPLWDWGPYYPGGAVQGKATTSDMAAAMSFSGHAGHPCGEDFLAKPFLAAHPEYAWMSPILRDLKSGPWTTFTAGERAK
ncbi:C45 family autoproteolytic acyltransferase/hydolase [Paracidobacterium acidisoli]|uniref:Peptidase C45 n=1 Tax=Paracidobacterium acidisoli TaxID=2303751 RepID=A0A372IRL8_9BACT|nr:C45 family peptidase [Paracidobacterium acidisoli]MBT9330441.1 peptidase C45 [Paracidobacterium acidisoli]